MSKPMILGVLLLALLFASVLYGSARAMTNATLEYTVDAIAAPAAGYELTWYTISSGGALAGNSYSLVGTIGQPDAGTQSGGSYGLSSGYWGTVQSFFDSFLPLIKK